MSVQKRGGNSQIKHNQILTAKQAKFVHKELSTGSNTISIKKSVIPNIPEETEPDNIYQKEQITGHENRIKQHDQKKSPAQMKEWSILSNHVRYVTSDRSETFNNLSIDKLNYR